MKKKLLSIMLISLITCGMLIGCGDSSSKADNSTAPKTTEAPKETAKTTETPKEAAKKETSTTEAKKAEVIQVPVTIINGTDVDFSELYTSSTKVEEWGDNLIDKGAAFSPGKTIKATFGVDANNLKWDFKAVDGNGDSLEFEGLDLSNCDSSGVKIKLSYDRNTQTGTITAE